MGDLFDTAIQKLLRKEFPDLDAVYLFEHQTELLNGLASSKDPLDQAARSIEDYLPPDLFRGMSDPMASAPEPSRALVVRRKTRAASLPPQTTALLELLGVLQQKVLDGEISGLCVLGRCTGKNNMEMYVNNPSVAEMMSYYGFMTHAVNLGIGTNYSGPDDGTQEK